MKKATSFFAGIIFLILPAVLFAQDAKKKTEVIYIQTSAICGECKERIELAVNDLKGVKKSDLDLKDSKIMVEYQPEKISPDAIKSAIAKSGYDADEMMADTNAYANLPKCCQKEAEKH